MSGGGAVETELSRYLRVEGLKCDGKDQLVLCAVAKALEVIPTQLAQNSGFDPTDILNALRKKHLDEDGLSLPAAVPKTWDAEERAATAAETKATAADREEGEA